MKWPQKYHDAILKTKRELTDEDVFLSERYYRLLKKIAGEITKPHFQNIQIVNDSSMPVGYFDGEKIVINLANHITQSFPNKDLKNKSMTGLLGHECGHVNFTNMHLRKMYLHGILKEHKLYPYAPVPETQEDCEKLLSMQEVFEQKESATLTLFYSLAKYLHNALEDAYINQKMSGKYPGTIREGILLNNMRMADAAESVKNRLEAGKSKSVVMMSMIAQYAILGDINYWDGCDQEYLDCLDACIPIIIWSRYTEGENVRFIATNQILLKMWDFIKENADELEERRRREQTEQEENAAGPDESEQTETETGQNTSQDNASATGQKQENGSESIEESEKSQNSENQQIKQLVKELVAMLPQLSPDYAIGETNEASDGFQDGKWETKPECFLLAQKNNSAEEKPQFDQEVSAFVFNLAKEITDQNQEEELKNSLRDLLHDIDYGDQHANIRKEVYRESVFSEETVKRYQDLNRQLKQVQRRLQVQLLPLLEKQKTRMEKGMAIGRKMDNRTLYRPDHRIFARRQLESNENNVAVAVLVDLSGSMIDGRRIAYARLAALTLYQFSIEAGMPITVYGHNVQSADRVTEQVCLHSLAEFDSVDGKDRLRIVDMTPRGCNRDGVAIRFVGEHLKRRAEKQKLFVLISDGLPNASSYGGASAREDLKEAKTELEKAGITFIAAAIGDDKSNIQEIYEDAFLDISNLQKLPEKLAKQVIRTIS